MPLRQPSAPALSSGRVSYSHLTARFESLFAACCGVIPVLTGMWRAWEIRAIDEVGALGPLDVLVHNAASGVVRDALDTEEKHWDWTLGANARALLALTTAAGPQMPAGSSIVGISSLGAQRVLPGYTLVGVSKAALEALIRYLAVELAPRGIRVNAVSAGVVETGALEHFPNREEMLAFGRANPAGRLVEPDDIAAAVAFLCSPDAEMVRGHVLVVDGGFSLSV